MTESPLDRAIRESKERDEKATPGPIKSYECKAFRLDREIELRTSDGSTIRSTSYGVMREDANFFAKARTWEPAFRKMVGVAREVLNRIACVPTGFEPSADNKTAKVALEMMNEIAKENL